MKPEKENDKEIEKENDSSTISTNHIYSNLSTSEEINISFEKTNTELSQSLSPDIFRCHLCKELLITKIKREGDFLNVDYNCQNHHFGSLEISLFLSKIIYFSFIYAKCAKCREEQIKSKEIFYFCKDCEEIYCPKDIKECRLSRENVVSLEDLDFLCIKHKKDYISFCEECNENLCEVCVESEEHKKHKKYFFKENYIGKEESDKIDRFIQQGGVTKNRFEDEIENLMNKYLEEKTEDEIDNLKNQIKENIHVYGNLIFYAYCIKKSYDFCVNCKRFNHQIITNLYDLIKSRLCFIENKFSDINNLIYQLSKKLLYYPYKADNIQSIPNKIGIRIKDQIIKNYNNNIKINPQQNSNESKKRVIKKYIFEDGEYEGEIREGLPHGEGKFKYKNGDQYSGEFKNGLFDGKGDHISKKGEKYSGQFKKGKRDGEGTCIFINGENYSGYWKDNKRDGKGKYTFSNGDFYKGEFKEDMFNGKGTLEYSNGNKTLGMWKNNYRNGIEILFNKKGEIFFHVFDNNTLMQEKKLDSTNFQRDFKDFTDEQIIEYYNNYYQNQLKKK